MNYTKGPLHIWAKSRDHGIVGAQRKCPKAVPPHLQNHVAWSRIPSAVWSHTWSSPQPNVILRNVYSNGSSHMIKWNKWMIVFENNPSDHETWSIGCHVENHVDFTSILYQTLLRWVHVVCSPLLPYEGQTKGRPPLFVPCAYAKWSFKTNQNLANEGDIMRGGGNAIGGGSIFRCSEASEATR
jgi:hypothetical protein